jgi:hypothetical protein
VLAYLNLSWVSFRLLISFWCDFLCHVTRTDYPGWMASDVEFKRLYLFNTLDGCCEKWFTPYNLDGCKSRVIQGLYSVLPCPLNRPDCNNAPAITNVTDHKMNMWYPDMQGSSCKNDRQMPEWMLAEGYTEWYLFNSREQCCSKFGLC